MTHCVCFDRHFYKYRNDNNKNKIMFQGIKRIFGGGNSGMSRQEGYQTNHPYISSDDLPPATFDSAMSVSAVWLAIRLQSENIASLPLKFYKTTNGAREEDNTTEIARLFTGGKINRYQDKISFLETLIVNLESWGNSYNLIQRNTSGNLIGLLPLAADQVEVELQHDGSLLYHYNDGHGRKTYTADQIWHISLFGNGIEGLSPLSYARRTIGIGLQANKRTARVMSNAGKRTGVFSVDTDDDLTQEQKDGLRREYSALASGDEDYLPVLPVGIKFEPLSLTPADQELLDNRRFSVVEVARIFNVPPILLHSMDNSTTLGSSTSEVMNSFYKTSLRPLITKIEDSMRIRFMTQSERKNITVHFDLDELLRPLPGERWQNWKTAVESGAMTPNEIRRKENLPPIGGAGDELLANSALKPVRSIEKGDQQAKTE